MLTRSKFAALALALSLLLPVYFMASALGVKFGLWSWRLGLGVLIVQWGPRLVIAATVAAAVALILLLFRQPHTGWLVAFFALMIPVVSLGYLAWLRNQSAGIPPIHDVATDVADPPTPSARLLALRAADEASPVQDMRAPLVGAEAYQGPRFTRFGDKSLGQVGREAYPALQTLEVVASPAVAFAAARDAAQRMGWTVVTDEEHTGVLEATAATFWFGFKDDVIVRVRPAADGQGARIDVRSISRVGLSDMGTNAKRVEAYLARVATGLAS